MQRFNFDFIKKKYESTTLHNISFIRSQLTNSDTHFSILGTLALKAHNDIKIFHTPRYVEEGVINIKKK